MILNEQDLRLLHKLLADDLFQLVVTRSNISSIDIEKICSDINDEYMMNGILPNYEPNEYGMLLNDLLGKVNLIRLNED